MQGVAGSTRWKMWTGSIPGLVYAAGLPQTPQQASARRGKSRGVSIHHDGSVSLATALGGHRMSSDSYFEGWQVESSAIECATADLMALVRITAEATGNDEYDIRIGIDWSGEQSLSILTKDNHGFAYDGVSTPLHLYTPVDTTVNAVEPASEFHWHVHDLAQDCINQGGISNVLMIRPPERDDHG
jgi:hypothetical protein